jgi:DNA-binding NarL/FixJ family response regulator
MSKVRVLLADDHESILAKIRGVLAQDFEVVAAVSDGREAVQQAQLLKPDVLVMDISMPVLDGLQAASLLRRNHNQAKIVFLTVHEDDDFVDTAFAAGASGYVVKAQLATDLVPAIHKALEGQRYVSLFSRN